MADPLKSYIRRNRPELASYRTKKSFWENLADGNENKATKKRPVSVPTFGDIRRKFAETNERRSRASAKNNGADANAVSSQKGSTRESGSPNSRTVPSPSTDDLSRTSSRRRSLEKPKKTFLHMTEVMDGYVPSDSDSIPTEKEKSTLQREGNGQTLASIDATVDVPIQVEVAVENSRESPTHVREGSFRRRNRVRRRGSGKEPRYDPVKKEDIENARKGPINITLPAEQEQHKETDRNSQSKEQAKIAPSTLKSTSVFNSPSDNDRSVNGTSDVLQSRKKPDLAFQGDKTITSSTNISLSRPDVVNKSNETMSSKKHLTQLRVKEGKRERTNAEPSSRSPNSPSKYESIFMGKSRNFVYPMGKQDIPKSDKTDMIMHNSTNKEEKVSPHSKHFESRTHILSTDIEYSSANESIKASDGVDSSSETVKSSDPADFSCSEHRWSTIDSGISVASILQQDTDVNRNTLTIVQPCHIPSVGLKTLKPKRCRRESSSSSDSDDDSGISWDELRDIPVPLVVIDKVQDENHEKGESSNVRVELDNSFDNQISVEKTNILEPASKTKNASSIGSRINQKFQLWHDDDINLGLKKDQPLRTSTPTFSDVSAVDEPSISDPKMTANPQTSFMEPEIRKSDAYTPSNIPISKRSTISKQGKHDDKNDERKSLQPSQITEAAVKQPSKQAFRKDTIPMQSYRCMNTDDSEVFDDRSSTNMSDNMRSRANTPQTESSCKDRVRSKSESSDPDLFKVRSRLLTRQSSVLDPMDDVLTKRSPFRVPSSLTNQNDIGSTLKKNIPGKTQYQMTHTHSRTNYNMPGSLYRAKSNPILYEPSRVSSNDDDEERPITIKPVIKARQSSVPRSNAPPIFTPSPPQPTSLASRLLPQKRRSVHGLTDVGNESFVAEPNASEDNGEQLTSFEKLFGTNNPNESSFEVPIKTPLKSPGYKDRSLVFSESDNEESPPKKNMAPSLRLRQKVRSRNSPSVPRSLDLSFSDTESTDGTVVLRKRRRSRTKSQGDDDSFVKESKPTEGSVNIQLKSSELGDRKIDTLDSQHQSQARRQISLSKSHKTSTKHVDRDSDLDNSLNEEQPQSNTKETKHMKDRNNNMISKQNKSRLSLEQLAEEEIISSASKLQIDLYKHKKHFEKDLSKRLESAMEESDNLVSAIRRGMDEPRTKDKVVAAKKNVDEVIKFDVIRDYRARLQWYKVDINLGCYTKNVDARKTSNLRVTVSCEMPDGPKFSKDIHLDFPESVDLSQLEILQVGNNLELRAPFKTWNPPASIDDVIETDGGDPKDTFARIGFLEKAYKSLGLSWPPEGATAHYEYISTRGQQDTVKRVKKPPEYQSLIDSGKLKTCAV